MYPILYVMSSSRRMVRMEKKSELAKVMRRDRRGKMWRVKTYLRCVAVDKWYGIDICIRIMETSYPIGRWKSFQALTIFHLTNEYLNSYQRLPGRETSLYIIEGHWLERMDGMMLCQIGRHGEQRREKWAKGRREEELGRWDGRHVYGSMWGHAAASVAAF